MKFLHAADLHLDSPLRGLQAYEGAPVDALRGATRRALENLVDLALAEGVAFVVIAGDLYDGPWRDANTGLFLRSQMQRLDAAEIPVVLLSGNHDAESVIARTLPLPAGCTVLSTAAPQTVQLPGAGAAIHGQGFATRAVREDLSAAYPPPVDGVLNVGLLHTSADGHADHEPYAPCSVANLVAHGYAYWALGHVHERRVLHEDPWVVFAGNPQGRHAREPGARGATLVTYEGEQVADVEAVALDVVRWARVGVDAGACETRDEALEAVADALATAVAAADGRLLAARVELEGASPAHADLAADPAGLADEVRALALDHGERLWIEKVRVRTVPAADPAQARLRDDALGELLRSIDVLDERRIAELAADFAPLRTKLPTEVRTGAEPLDPTAPQTVRELLPDVERLLLARLRPVET